MSATLLGLIATYGPALVVAILAGFAEWKRRQAKAARVEASKRLGIAENALGILTTAIEAAEKALPKEESTIKRLVEAVTTARPAENAVIRKAIVRLDPKKVEDYVKKMK